MRAPAKFRGEMVSYDGGTTWRSRSSANWGDSSHSGASTTSRELASWNPVAGSPDADLLGDLGVLTPRSRDLHRNHGYAHAAIQTKVDNVVGPTGLRLAAMPDYRALGKSREWAEAWSDDVEAKFRPWAETTECDAAGLQNLAGLCRSMFQGSLLNGSGLALSLWMPRPRSKFATRLQVIESDRLTNPNGMMDGANLRGGIAQDDYGRPLGYWVRKTHPGDLFMGLAGGAGAWGQSEYIPAETSWGRKRVIHAYDVDRAGQSRGKPDFSTVLTRFKMLDHYERTEVQAAVAQAMVTTFIETPMGPDAVQQMLGGGDLDAVQKYVDARSGQPTVKLRGASAIPLFPGEKITPFAPTRPNAVFGMFVENVLRHIAAGLDLPLELLTKDFTKTTYTSARAMLMEAWRFFLGRRKWLSDQVCTPCYLLWLEEMVNAGEIEAPNFYEQQYAYSRAEWIGTGRGWIDATKEVDAAGKRLAFNLTTLQRECAEQGLDWREVLEQRAIEVAECKRLGLPLPELIIARMPAQMVEAEDEELPAGSPAGGVAA